MPRKKSTGTDMKRKPVAFNILDPDEKRLYEHANKRTNFSRYVKSLIQRDMEGLPAAPSVPAPKPQPEDRITKDIASSFVK